MSIENEDLEIILDDSETDLNADDSTSVDSVPEPTRNDVKSDVNGIEELKANLESERKARIAAENRLNQATSEVDDVNLTLVTQAIDTVKRDAEVLKANYSVAMSAGDYDAAGDIQLAMASNQAKLLQLENGKASMLSRPKVNTASDPVENLARQLTPRSAAWVRAHPQYATDQRLYTKMVAAHQLAVADGIAPDSDDYFRSVEETLRINPMANADNPLSSAANATQRRSAPPAAPVSRSGTPGKQNNVVTLSRAEREAARDMGMTEKEYAVNKAALMREGRMTVN